MRTILILYIMILSSLYTNAVVIKRGAGRKEIRTKQLKYQHYSNIFNDYGWSYPDIKSLPVNFSNESFNFNFKGSSFDLHRNADGSISLTSNGANLGTSKEQTSNGDIYFDKHILGNKTIMRQRWVPYTHYVSRMVPVTKYRSVTTYVYDYSTKSSRAQSSQQMYTSYEMRSTAQTDYRWEVYAELVIDVPKYQYYDFTLSDSTNIILYRVDNNYYLQNVSYIYAEDNDGLKYILIDNNMNGSYTDVQDRIMFSSWNPYSKNSSYRKSLFLVSNKWYEINYLSTEYFLDFATTADVLTMDYKNDKYISGSDKGKIFFKNLPEKATFQINGKRYALNDRERGFKSEYGMYKITIKKRGYLDYDTVVVVDEKSPAAIISYKNTDIASTVEIQNIYSDGYFVNVSNNRGFRKTFYNLNKIEVPVGFNNFEIQTDGITVAKNLRSSAEGQNAIDFEQELKTQIPPEEEKKK